MPAILAPEEPNVFRIHDQTLSGAPAESDVLIIEMYFAPLERRILGDMSCIKIRSPPELGDLVIDVLSVVVQFDRGYLVA